MTNKIRHLLFAVLIVLTTGTTAFAQNRCEDYFGLQIKTSSNTFLSRVYRDIRTWADRISWLKAHSTFPNGTTLGQVQDNQNLFAEMYTSRIIDKEDKDKHTPLLAEIAVGHLLLAEEFLQRGQIPDPAKAVDVVFSGYDQFHPSTNYVVTYLQRARDYTDLVKHWLPGVVVGEHLKMKQIVGIGRAVKRTEKFLTPVEVDVRKNLFDKPPFKGKKIIELSRAGLFEQGAEIRTVHHQKLIEAALNLVEAGEENETVIVASVHDQPSLKQIWRERFGFRDILEFQNIPLDAEKFGDGTVDIIAVDVPTLKAHWLDAAQKLLADSIASPQSYREFSRQALSLKTTMDKFREEYRTLISFGHNDMTGFSANFTPFQFAHVWLNGWDQFIKASGTYKVIKSDFLLNENDPRSAVDVVQVNMSGRDEAGRELTMTYSVPLASGILHLTREYRRVGRGSAARIENVIRYTLDTASRIQKGSYVMNKVIETADREEFTETLSVPFENMPLFPRVLDPDHRPWFGRFLSRFPTTVRYAGRELSANSEAEFKSPALIWPANYSWNQMDMGMHEAPHLYAEGGRLRSPVTDDPILKIYEDNNYEIPSIPMIASLYSRARTLLREVIPLDLYFDALGFQRQP